MTTITEIIDDGNLTTDARPQPPREENVIVQEAESTEKVSIENIQPSIPRTYHKRSKQSKTKPKTGSSRKYHRLVF